MYKHAITSTIRTQKTKKNHEKVVVDLSVTSEGVGTMIDMPVSDKHPSTGLHSTLHVVTTHRLSVSHTLP
jgi:hypothetical protein